MQCMFIFYICVVHVPLHVQCHIGLKCRPSSYPTIIFLIRFLPFFPVTGRSIDKKLQLANLASFALSPGKPPYKIAVYVPGTKVRLCDYTTYMCIYI